ncbi:MAG: hypothetical protein ACKOZM_06305, partial [Flavobacteriales bacterium]
GEWPVAERSRGQWHVTNDTGGRAKSRTMASDAGGRAESRTVANGEGTQPTKKVKSYSINRGLLPSPLERGWG